MAVTISVPGANHTTVFRTYTDAGNSALAQSIAATIATLTNLTVSSVTGGGQVAIPITSPQGLEFSGTGSYTVPSGYAYAVDNVSPAALAVSMGGGVFIGGDGNIGFTNAPGASDTVLAGNGNDTFALSGRYQVAAAPASSASGAASTPSPSPLGPTRCLLALAIRAWRSTEPVERCSITGVTPRVSWSTRSPAAPGEAPSSAATMKRSLSSATPPRASPACWWPAAGTKRWWPPTPRAAI